MGKNGLKRTQGESASAGRTRNLRGLFLVFLGATFWGFSATCVKCLTERNDASVLWLADTRLFVAGVLFLVAALVLDRDKFRVLLQSRALIVQMVGYVLIAVVLMQIGYMASIKYTNPGTALLLLELSIPMVLVYECIRAKRSPTKLEGAAIVLAFAGVTAIATQGNIGSLGISPLGLLFGLMSAVANAGYILLSARLVRECGALVTNAIGMLFGAILLAPWGQPWDVPAGMDGTGWIVFAGIVLIGTMAAYAAFSTGVTMTNTVTASLVGVFEPVSGAVISALWLGTVFSGWDLLGGALIIAMMVMVALHR